MMSSGIELYWLLALACKQTNLMNIPKLWSITLHLPSSVSLASHLFKCIPSES